MRRWGNMNTLENKNFAYIDGANLHKRTDASIAYINDQKSILQVKNKKAPDGDKIP